MHCPKCGTENPDDAKSCQSCNRDLTHISSTARRLDANAVASLVLAILSIALLFLLAGIHIILGVLAAVFVCPAVGITALVLGIIALAEIRRSAGRLSGKGLAIAGITIPTVWLSALFLYLGYSLRAKPYAHKVRQKAQFHTIDAALELFNHEFDGYPPSDAVDSVGQPYCGGMKLCEAVMGQDLLGFHPDSVFRADGMDPTGQRDLYLESIDKDNLRARRGPFTPAASANAHKLIDVYGGHNIGPFGDGAFVLCDTYKREHKSGVMVGMPILYYKANAANSAHDVNNPDNPENIYNYKDNHALVGLGVPGQPGRKHPLFADPKIFYEMTRNYEITTQSRPFRADSYILLSAGKDGSYGTEDDIVNFDMRWKPKSRR